MMMDDTPLHYLSIAEAGRRIRAGSLTSTALVQACLSRIEALDDRLHAFITVVPDRALEGAWRADQEIKAGHVRGPLHGIPVAHKDNILTRGIRTTAHSRLLDAWVPEEDAPVHRQLTDNGAVLVGKLSLWEFAVGAPAPDSAFPAARNPWNTSYNPGGSSSGSGVAVAAGLCLGATGTDTGGSIRNPSAACGIVGLKPTFGLVSVDGTLPLSVSLDHVGPMTRSVRDNAMMLDAMVAPGACPQGRQGYGADIGAGIAGMRLGVPTRLLERIPYDTACLDAFHMALEALQAQGASIVPFDLPELEHTAQAGTMIMFNEAYEYHRAHLEQSPNRLAGTLRRVLEIGKNCPAQELAGYRALIVRLKESFARLLNGAMDAVVTPGSTGTPVSIEALMSPDYRHVVDPARILFNVLGLPALVLPMGLGAMNLPLALQIAAGWGMEAKVYQVAAAYEAVSGWQQKRPAL